MSWILPPTTVEGVIDYHDLGDEDNYSQPRVFWKKVLDEGGKSRLVDNLANSLKLTNERIRNRAIDMFSNVDADMGDRLRNMLATEVVVNL